MYSRWNQSHTRCSVAVQYILFEPHISFSHLFISSFSVWSVWVSVWLVSSSLIRVGETVLWFFGWLSDVCFLWLVVSGFNTISLLCFVYCFWPSTYSKRSRQCTGLLIVVHFRLLTDSQVVRCVKLHVLSPHSLFRWCDKQEVVYLKRVFHWNDLNFTARSHFLLISSSKQAENVSCVQLRLQICHKKGEINWLKVLLGS